MNIGTSSVSNRRPATDNPDSEALERENDRELQELSSKATYLRQITAGMKDDVEQQNLILNSVDDRLTSVRTGLSGVVGKFKQVLETPNGKKNMVIIITIFVVLLLMFSVNAFRPSMAVYTWETFGISVATNLIICAVCLILFDLLRCKESLRRFYAPRYYVKSPGYRRPKPLPLWSRSCFGWIRCLAGYSETEILAVAGYDGLVYLRIFRFGVQLFTVLTVFLCAVVLPVNFTDDRVDQNQIARKAADDEDDVVESTDFEKVTMANIQQESNRMWAHVFATWFICLFTLWLLWKYHRSALELRIEFLASTKKGGSSHSIFVSDIPGIRFGHPLERLIHSCFFMFLPSSVKKRVIDSVEAMTKIATSSVGMVGQIGNSAVGASRGVLTGNTSAQTTALLSTPENDALNTFVRPVAKDITDMNPDAWIQQKLGQGMRHEQAVDLMFGQVFPQGEICCANMVMHTTSLESLVKKLDKAVQSLEDTIDQYAIWIRQNRDFKKFKTRIIPLIEGKWATEKYGQKPLKVDLLEFLVLKIKNMEPLIQEEDGKAKGEVTASAFVVFNSRWSQVVGASGFLHHFESTWNAQSAPNPNDVVWENLKWRTWERKLRQASVWGMFFMLCAFFMIPVAAVQAIIEVDRLESYDVIGSIVKFPIVKSLLASVIPNLALQIFLAILPMLLRLMSHYQGIISRSAIDAEVIRKYFIFLVITVFLANFFSRTVLQELNTLVNNPGDIIDILGAGAPGASTFFLYFIMTSAFIGGSIQMLQIPGLVLTWIFTYLSGTQRGKDRIWQYKPMRFGHIVSMHTLTILLGLVFSVVNPLIAPVTLCYFLLMTLVDRYSLLYVLSEDYQSGGALWNYIYEHVIVALIFQQLMMLGILGVKKFYYSVLIIPLPLLTIAFKILVDGRFRRPLNLLSLRAARDLDELDQREERKEQFSESASASDPNASYVNNCFKVDWKRIENLINDVTIIEAAMEIPHKEAVPMMANLHISSAAEFYSIESHALASGEAEETPQTEGADKSDR